MCQAPATLADGTVIACRNCPQCRDLRIADWQGRNIAEAKTATKSFAVTLTYGRVKNEVLHSHAVALFYSDVQKYLKLLRRHGYTVRYFVTGEFGGLKGRTHWHIVLHFYGAIPPHVLDENWNDEHWPHGFSFWTEAHARTVQYNCKYIMKDLDDAESQGHLAMSKKPPLGFQYFAERARSAARQGIHLRNLDYSFPDVRFVKGERAGQRKPYRLTGRSAELYVEEYIAEWVRVQTQPLPQTELLLEYNKGWLREIRRIKERRLDRPAQYTRLELWKLQRDDERKHALLRANRPVGEFVPVKEPVTQQQIEAHLWEVNFEREFAREQERRQEAKQSQSDGGRYAAVEAAERSEFYEGKLYRRNVYGGAAKPKRTG